MMLRFTTGIGLFLLLCSCASQSNSPKDSSAQTPAPANAAPRAAASDAPNIPKGAQFTIYAGRIEGEMHIQRAEHDKAQLIAQTKMKDWYVIHSDAQSLLYYGYYRSINDPKDAQETARAQNDRRQIELLGDQMGNRPFKGAMFVDITAPDPTAPPAWNLVNAKGEWTLQIAVYKGSPDRKQAAVDTVAAARKAGIEAYYYHGESASLVCIGAWPASAVRVTDTVRSPAGGDPNQTLMVVPMSNDAEMNQAFDSVAKQQNINIVRSQVQILDPTLEATRREYPHNAINGVEMKHIVDGHEVFDSSLIHTIPHEALPTMTSPLGPTQTGEQPAYDPNYRPELPKTRDVQPAPPQPTGGRLRSIGG